jgi:hypothetical protein
VILRQQKSNSKAQILSSAPSPDHQLTPVTTTYIGTMYNRLTGGIDNGYLSKDSLSTVGGIRFRW